MRKVFKLIWRCDRRAVSLKLFYTLVASVLPLANLYVLKLMVDSVAGLATSHIQFADSQLPLFVALFCGIALAGRLVGVLNTVNNDVLSQKLTDYISDLIQRQSVKLDMSYYDNPDYHDTFHRAQSEAAFRPMRILEHFMALFGSVVSLAGVVAMLLVASWKVTLLMLVAILPSFFVRLYKSRSIYNFRRQTTETVRRTNYYGQLLSNRLFAKEVRAFRLADFFRSRFVATRCQLVQRLLAISRRLAAFDAVSAVVEAAAMGLVLVGLTVPVIDGAISLGSFVMLFEAFRRGQGYLNSLVNSVGGLYEHRLFVNNLFEFLDLKPSVVSPDQPVSFPDDVLTVQFDNVSFAYPGAGTQVLTNFSLTARKGEPVVLDGENGSGKTTLLKLLLRLYDPQEGSVRINGIDIRMFNLSELRKNVGVLFQDYVQFHFTARENISFGDIDNPDDAERLDASLRLASAEPVVASLGNGLDTQLGRQFSNGEELSMGQWQRLALARQLYTQAPILFFDEATAWMDANASRRFQQTVEQLKASHVIIMVNHRSGC